MPKAWPAALAGIVFAIGSVFITFGGSLVAMLAIGVAWAIARRRGRPLTRGAGWLVGALTVGTLILAGAAVAMTRVPQATFADFGRAMDSTATAPPPAPPEWLRKITPPNAQRPSPTAEAFVRSRAFTIWTAVMGLVLAAGLLAAYAGSLGWMAAMLVCYGITGDWLPRSEPIGPPALGDPLGRRRAADVGPP